jgi:hypothetical protein
MCRLRIMFVAVLLSASLCFAQDASSASSPNASAIGHGAFPVKVTKTLDSSKLKSGDSVEVETAGSFKLPNGTLVPKGSKLMGHVVEAKARSKGDSDSQLTINFEKLNVGGGEQLSIKGAVQAVFPPADEQLDPSITGAATTASGGSMTGGANPAAGGGAGGGGNVGVVTNSHSGSNMESSNAQGAMNSHSMGVQGIHDLSLDNGVLSSKGKQVKLGNGVRMIVRADILG